MKRFLALIVCIIMALSTVSCKDDETPSSQSSTTPSGSQGTSEKEDVTYEVSGKSYVADITTINIAWDEDREVTQIQKETFIAVVKTEFKNSAISFLGENSVKLSGTNNQSHDFSVENCDRIENELFAEVDKKGKIDILIYEDKISFMCDFFSGWYFSIDYKLTASNPG